jgi:hypothetical protein
VLTFACMHPVSLTGNPAARADVRMHASRLSDWQPCRAQAYIWISMPFLSSDLGVNTEISTYWWGCPTTEAEQPCGSYYNITPTISYLHSALEQTFALYVAFVRSLSRSQKNGTEGGSCSVLLT